MPLFGEVLNRNREILGETWAYRMNVCRKGMKAKDIALLKYSARIGHCSDKRNIYLHNQEYKVSIPSVAWFENGG